MAAASGRGDLATRGEWPNVERLASCQKTHQNPFCVRRGIGEVTRLGWSLLLRRPIPPPSTVDLAWSVRDSCAARLSIHGASSQRRRSVVVVIWDLRPCDEVGPKRNLDHRTNTRT